MEYVHEHNLFEGKAGENLNMSQNQMVAVA